MILQPNPVNNEYPLLNPLIEKLEAGGRLNDANMLATATNYLDARTALDLVEYNNNIESCIQIENIFYSWGGSLFNQEIRATIRVIESYWFNNKCRDSLLLRNDVAVQIKNLVSRQ